MSTPSLSSIIKAGNGPADSSNSSLGSGRGTFSLLERSIATPTGDVVCMSSFIGICARRESSAIAVVVNILF